MNEKERSDRYKVKKKKVCRKTACFFSLLAKINWLWISSFSLQVMQRRKICLLSYIAKRAGDTHLLFLSFQVVQNRRRDTAHSSFLSSSPDSTVCDLLYFLYTHSSFLIPHASCIMKCVMINISFDWSQETLVDVSFIVFLDSLGVGLSARITSPEITEHIPASAHSFFIHLCLLQQFPGIPQDHI